MSRIDRYPLPTEQEFETLAHRYIVVPGALWAAAMLVAVIAALAQPADAPAQMATPDEQAATTVVGA
jgi:hypothetical protein